MSEDLMSEMGKKNGVAIGWLKLVLFLLHCERDLLGSGSKILCCRLGGRVE